jgi:hypothetical protein
MNPVGTPTNAIKTLGSDDLTAPHHADSRTPWRKIEIHHHRRQSKIGQKCGNGNGEKGAVAEDLGSMMGPSAPDSR